MRHVDEGTRVDEDEVAALRAHGDEWMLQQCRGWKRLDLVGGSALCKRGLQFGGSTKMYEHVYIQLGSVSDVPRKQLIAAALGIQASVLVPTEGGVTSKRRHHGRWFLGIVRRRTREIPIRIS